MILLCEFSVLGVDPVPWSVPNIGTATTKAGTRVRFARRGKKMRTHLGQLSLADWQALVRAAAVEAMGELPPPTGAVHLELTFVATTPPGKRHGELWFIPLRQDESHKWHKAGRNEPDLVNLIKGTEDALAGTLFTNDVQTRMITALTVYGPLPGVHIHVGLIEPEDHPGWGELMPAPLTRKRVRAARGK